MSWRLSGSIKPQLVKFTGLWPGFAAEIINIISLSSGPNVRKPVVAFMRSWRWLCLREAYALYVESNAP
jgi:hypothetical protein